MKKQLDFLPVYRAHRALQRQGHKSSLIKGLSVWRNLDTVSPLLIASLQYVLCISCASVGAPADNLHELLYIIVIFITGAL